MVFERTAVITPKGGALVGPALFPLLCLFSAMLASCGGTVTQDASTILTDAGFTEASADRTIGVDARGPETSADVWERVDSPTDTFVEIEAREDAWQDARPACTPELEEEQWNVIAQTPHDACYSGSISLTNGEGGVGVWMFATVGWFPSLCSDSAANAEKTATWINEIEQAIEQIDPYCATGVDVIHGGSYDEAETMYKAIVPQCFMKWDNPSIRISFDETGVVSSVSAEEPEGVSQDLIDCVREALSGQVFKCLGGFDFCSDWNAPG